VETLEDYINYRASETGPSVGELYGTEVFAYFLYSLVRMDRPSVIVELGCGGGATSLMVSKALYENQHGHLWTIDNGMDWKSDFIRETCQSAFGRCDSRETYPTFIGGLFARYGFEKVSTLVEKHMGDSDFYCPGSAIDMVFADATPSNVEGCLSVLRYYLPRVTFYSSIFIDRAVTINHSFLFLKYIISQLNIGKVPLSLVVGMNSDEKHALEQLVRGCEFQLVTLTETKFRKKNKLQNSRAWIKIQPVDYIPHNKVLNFGSITQPWEMDQE